MIKALKSLFEPARRETEETLQHRLRLAAAALLVETARADFSQNAVELAKLEQLLASALKLRADEVQSLVATARENVEDATSLYDFTRVINEHCTPEQKLQLIGAMWTVAYADGDADKYEEHLIRNVADLLYVPHSNYIQCKLAARG
jgi:uncharacterized tellurite resistance protein B-like protein